MNAIFEKLHKGLIVSCQAEGDSPFNSPAGVAAFAIAAERGGAVGIRSEGIEKTKEIIHRVSIPVIGLVKSYFPDGYVRITGSVKDVEELLGIGCSIVAIDGTTRERENLSGPEFIRKLKKNPKLTVMADIATTEEAQSCVDAGADCISTTLSGYTPGTSIHKTNTPDFELLKKLVSLYSHRLPVFAEGRFNSPADAREAIRAGAWAVVVGTAITRPQVITQWFSDAIKE